MFRTARGPVLASQVCVVGIGRTTFARPSGRTPLAMAAEAVRAALDDAGLNEAEVDGIVGYAVGDSVRSIVVLDAIGVEESSWCQDVFGGGNHVGGVVSMAAAAIEHGECEVAVVYRSLNGYSGRRFGEVGSELLDGMEFDPESQFSAPHGYLTPPQQLAMWARRHQHVYGSTNEDLGRICMTERAHAVANPHAIARTPLSMEEYLAGRMVNDPLRVFDCCYEVDGAVAIVLTGAERARRLRQPPVWLVGGADSFGQGATWDRWEDMGTMYGRHAAPRLWKRTGLTPGDMDIACFYDCFSITVMAGLEDFGFCEKGGVGRMFADGRATYGGEVVVNPHGGLLSEGYLHGMNHHYEAVLQLRGQAGARQVQRARFALVTSGAGAFGGAVIYGNERP